MTSQNRLSRRIVGDALEHQSRRAIGERPIDDVAVASHPADVGRAPIDVAVVIVEDILVGHRSEHEITTGGVHDAFRRPGRTRRVEDEQRILRLHRLGRTMRGHSLCGFIQPHISPGPPADVSASMSDDDHGLDATRLFDSRVDVSLERHLAATAKALVRSNDNFGFGVRDTAREGVWRKAAEHDRMDRAYASASEHRVGRLGNHGQVDRDAVALLDSVTFQHVGEMPDLTGQLRVRDVLGLRGVVAFPDDRGLARALG